MSDIITTTIYSGDISRGLLTVRLDPSLITGRKLGSVIGILLDPPTAPAPDPLADHPQLQLDATKPAWCPPLYVDGVTGKPRPEPLRP